MLQEKQPAFDILVIMCHVYKIIEHYRKMLSECKLEKSIYSLIKI